MSENAAPQTEAPVQEAQPVEQATQPAAQPTEPATGDEWQAKYEAMRSEMRKQEQRAKENKAAADELAQIRESQKTAEQKQTEALAKAQRDAESARSENLRFQAALEHNVPKDYLRFITGSTPEEIAASAKEAGQIAADRAELTRLKEVGAAQVQPPNNGVPVARMAPGATPTNVVVAEDAYPANWIPKADQ